MKIVKALKTTLASPLSAAGTSIVVSKFQDHKGNELALSDFGSWGVVAIKQGNTIELIKFDGVTQSGSSDQCTLTVATSGRNLNGTSPYAGSSTGEDFNSGAEVIVTNDPLTLSRFANLDVAATFVEVMTFASLPRTTAGNPVDDNDLVKKSYVDDAVAGSYPANRIVVSGTAGETLAAGNLVYLKTSDGRWWKCDADTASTVDNVLLGIAQGAGTAGAAVSSGVLIRGYDGNQTGLTANQIYYASNTAGGISTSAGTTEVTVGFSLSTTEIYFSPGFNQHITEDIQDALVGTSGTPSASNKYVTADDVSAAGASGKIVRLNGTAYPAGDGSALTAVTRFGGDGSDGALSITSGATNIDLGSASMVVKNYTSISITGTGYLTFTNPHANGTVVILKSQGAVVITSSATRAIDLRGIGATAMTAPTDYIHDTTSHVPTAGGVTGAAGASGAILDLDTRTWWMTNTTTKLHLKLPLILIPGGGGAAGGTPSDGAGTSTGGSGGRGGGALYIECGGALNFTGTIDISGNAGTAGANGSAQPGGGGGAGGNAGMALILYASLTANTGTITASGGAGGAGGDATNSGNGWRGGGGGGVCGGIAAGAAGGAGGTGVADATGNGAAGSGGAGMGGSGGGGAGANGARSGGAGGTSSSNSNLYLISKNYWF